jgi:hypothetical protein
MVAAGAIEAFVIGVAGGSGGAACAAIGSRLVFPE